VSTEAPDDPAAPASPPALEADYLPVAEAWASTVEFEEKLVIYDGRTHAMLILNVSAGQIWERCDGTRTLDEIVVELSELHRVDPMRVRDDVWSTVAKLASLDLIGDARGGADDQGAPGP
jgi:Coenzyme PQQ synthesis protein D (PqqD)